MRASNASLITLTLLLATSVASAQECPTALFPAIAADPANSEYPAPYISATCTGGNLIVESNGIPGYEFQQITPNSLRAQTHRWTVTLTPSLPARASSIPLLGDVAFTVSGLPIYGPNEGAQPAAEAYGDPVYNGIMDFCMGHTGPRGEYHMHAAIAECITKNATEGEPSPILGFALDGFPIYGPWGCLDAGCTEVVKLESSWERIADPTRDAWNAYAYVAKDDAQYLDRCNGRIGPDGTYRYHVTETFPYILGCYGGLDVVEDPPDPGTTTETHWVPIAASAAGAGGMSWSTDLAILNRSDAAAEVEVKLHEGEEIHTATTSVPAGGQTVIGDVAHWILGRAGLGSVEVASTSRVFVTTRTFTSDASGASFGQSLDGLEVTDGLAAGDEAWLPQLREDARFRTNLGVLNMGSGAATVEITLRDAIGATLATWTVDVPPGSVAVENRPITNRAGRTNVASAFAHVRVLAGTGLWTYASVVDNATGDPTTIAMKR